jgi:quercetin dioxygenase-like cupin family protein
MAAANDGIRRQIKERRQFRALPFDRARQAAHTARASPLGDVNRTKEIEMLKKLTWVALPCAAIVVAALYTGNGLATPSSGFSGTTIAMGQFGEVDVFNKLIGGHGNVWLSLQKTKGLSDAYVQSNVWMPGGHTGWHTHGGHSMIIVTAGTVTTYEGNDPNCTPTEYTQGMGFVDPGGDHVHLIRNEGNVPASTVAFQVLPAGSPRRIDVANPGNCPF